MSEQQRIEAAAAKRARKAERRRVEAERTADGRGLGWHGRSWLGSDAPMGHWDLVESWWRGFNDDLDLHPRWRKRLEARRALPWVGDRWWKVDGAQARKGWLRNARANKRARKTQRMRRRPAAQRRMMRMTMSILREVYSDFDAMFPSFPPGDE